VVSKKYLRDYRLEEQLGDDGCVKKIAVYIGGDYRISPDFRDGEKRLILLLSMLSGLFYILALIPVTGAARLTYVILPFVCSMLPVAITMIYAVSLYRIKEVMKRKQAEQLANRLPAGAAAASILTAIALIAFIITLIITRAQLIAGDIIFSILSALITAVSAYILIKCRNMKAIALSAPS